MKRTTWFLDLYVHLFNIAWTLSLKYIFYVQVDENLTEAERKAAWEEYENEKKGLIQTNVGIENITAFGAMLQGMLPRSGDGRVMASPINTMAIQHQLKSMNPELSHEELVMRTRSAIMQLQNLHRTQTPVIMNQNTLGVGQRQGPGYDQSFYQQVIQEEDQTLLRIEIIHWVTSKTKDPWIMWS